MKKEKIDKLKKYHKYEISKLKGYIGFHESKLIEFRMREELTSKSTIRHLINCISSRNVIIQNCLILGKQEEADKKYEELIQWVKDNYAINRK